VNYEHDVESERRGNEDEGDMNRKSSTASAREMRRNFTDAENELWKHLRNRRTDGEKFRRQQPIGKYIADFICLERKLVVEVDGGQHGENVAYDSERTAWLESQGYRVLGFWNNEVLENVEIVLEVIVRVLEESELYHPDPDPLPSRERGVMVCSGKKLKS
jgi:very-short-patch-repair endonuclease